MSDAALQSDTRDIVVDKDIPQPPEAVWKALTTAGMIARWIKEPVGFEPVVGNRFTFQTTPAGAWDGVIHCQVLEVKPNERLAYAWKGGHEANVGYGSRLDTVVTFILTRIEGGTHLRLVHSGFLVPRNQTALTSLGDGWNKVVETLGDVAGEQDRPDRHDCCQPGMTIKGETA
ncbi:MULTISPECIES: SRPBCC family protein [Inquilinus]|jgi:uncharacterized protein YndB with AHSA1/START domain|uniref:Uncharacterized protein YndB with AHSA1/START domain n=1 Tax=Inquilinus ginsengisoli TaxID=363840 RepID=A0ABU1JID9_9PROT|nr:SRPBCC domain-containing protein [Inquilinus ginsengisoli]MDR6288377.1 uncharacterized protein YndB with AHSA1/START domain [Inquilinus ginsengisoli]